ncbi:MAG: hypothetical protein P8K08_11300 [Fuerstiella sp.]|nr:hypothetical protein [Fuerstiella sp.]
MNKAFVREPDFDGRVYCPRCGSLGVPVHRETLDHHLRKQSRPCLGDAAWFCDFARCNVGYFDQFERAVEVEELQTSVYPKNVDAPVCACFGFTLDDIEADVLDGTPTRIRELLARSQSPDARCQTLSADGRCCMREVQRLYTRRTAEQRG